MANSRIWERKRIGAPLLRLAYLSFRLALDFQREEGDTTPCPNCGIFLGPPLPLPDAIRFAAYCADAQGQAGTVGRFRWRSGVRGGRAEGCYIGLVEDCGQRIAFPAYVLSGASRSKHRYARKNGEEYLACGYRLVSDYLRASLPALLIPAGLPPVDPILSSLLSAFREGDSSSWPAFLDRLEELDLALPDPFVPDRD